MPRYFRDWPALAADSSRGTTDLQRGLQKRKTEDHWCWDHAHLRWLTDGMRRTALQSSSPYYLQLDLDRLRATQVITKTRQHTYWRIPPAHGLTILPRAIWRKRLRAQQLRVSFAEIT